MGRLICAFVVTNQQRQFFSVAVQLLYVILPCHERLERKMRNLIFVKYDVAQTELLFAQSLQSICSVYVYTPRVILLVTVSFIIQPDIRK